ncbi:MAG: energy transducer TonB, partial [Bacteroidota bacterium]|nr:energy transducer TonB [Bacteroidota bacterium]
MTSLEKKTKRKGIIGTILFHALLFVAFLFMGLTYQDPPPPEEGISINFGFNEEGLGKIEPKDT